MKSLKRVSKNAFTGGALPLNVRAIFLDMAKGPNSYVHKRYRDHIRSLQRCFYCQDSIKIVHIEHIIPPIKGGNSKPENITGACARCNGLKSDFLLPVFLDRIVKYREYAFDKFLSFSGKYRRFKRRNINHTELNICLSKMSHFRKEHTYFTAIINSIINEKYKLYGERSRFLIL